MRSLSSAVEAHYDALNKSGDALAKLRRDMSEATESGDADAIVRVANEIVALRESATNTLPTLTKFVELWKANGKFTATESNDCMARILVDAGYARGVNGTLSMSYFKVERDIAREILQGVERIYAAIFTA